MTTLTPRPAPANTALLPEISPFAGLTGEIANRVRALKPYQPGKPIEEVKRELGLTGEIVKLASNENPLGPSPLGIKALQSALPRMALYPDGGCHDLRAAVSQKRDVSPEMLVFGNGSDEIIGLLGLSFLQADDEVVVGDPTFVLYEAAATLAGAKTVKVPLTRPDYAHDLTAMANAFTDKTRLVFIANPHNPTGSVVTKNAVDALLARLPARALLILDEAYGEYVYGEADDFPSAIDYVKAGAPVVGLRTFSKMYGLAGFRVGYGVADAEIIRVLNQPRSPFNVNLAGQIAATAAVADDDFVMQGKKTNRDGLEMLQKAFDELDLQWILSWANFIMVDVQRPCRTVFDALLRQGVIVRTGDIFGMPTHLRISIGTASQNQRFINALEAVLPHVPTITEARA